MLSYRISCEVRARQLYNKGKMNSEKKNSSTTKRRTSEMDFVKSVCIVLMVAFHIVYVEHQFPHAKDFVYLFHMPAFLVISGYFATTSYAKLKGKLRYLGITFLTMESAYIIMAAFLPINEHLPSLTAEVFLNKLFISPLGPYWYLHTLLISLSLYCIMHNVLNKHLSNTSFLILFLTLLSLLAGTLLATKSVVFFGLGVLIKMTGKDLLHIIRPSLFAIVPLLLILWKCCALTTPSLPMDSIFLSLVVTYLVMSSTMAICKYMPGKCKTVVTFVGKNTLPIFVLSPIFTFLAKPLVPLFAWDSTALAYTLVATLLTITGTLLLATVLDWTRLPHLILGKQLLDR